MIRLRAFWSGQSTMRIRQRRELALSESRVRDGLVLHKYGVCRGGGISSELVLSVLHCAEVIISSDAAVDDDDELCIYMPSQLDAAAAGLPYGDTPRSTQSMCYGM